MTGSNNKQEIQVFFLSKQALFSSRMKIIIFHWWLLLLVKYLFPYHLMKINPEFIEKKLEYPLFIMPPFEEEGVYCFANVGR